jgi:hypothetical protein
MRAENGYNSRMVGTAEVMAQYVCSIFPTCLLFNNPSESWPHNLLKSGVGLTSGSAFAIQAIHL